MVRERQNDCSAQTTGCSKSHCAKVWAYCSAPGHPILQALNGLMSNCKLGGAKRHRENMVNCNSKCQVLWL